MVSYLFIRSNERTPVQPYECKSTWLFNMETYRHTWHWYESFETFLFGGGGGGGKCDNITLYLPSYIPLPATMRNKYRTKVNFHCCLPFFLSCLSMRVGCQAVRLMMDSHHNCCRLQRWSIHSKEIKSFQIDRKIKPPLFIQTRQCNGNAQSTWASICSLPRNNGDRYGLRLWQMAINH